MLNGQCHSETNILVIGQNGVGKSYLLKKLELNFGLHKSESKDLNTLSTRYNKYNNMNFYEYSHCISSTFINENYFWNALILVVVSSADENDLLLSRNMLLDYYTKRKSSIIVIYHKFPNDKNTLTFNERNSILQIEGFSDIFVLELDYKKPKWLTLINKMYQYIIKENQTVSVTDF